MVVFARHFSSLLKRTIYTEGVLQQSCSLIVFTMPTRPFDSCPSCSLFNIKITNHAFSLQIVWGNELSSTWRRRRCYQNDTLWIPYMVKCQWEGTPFVFIPIETGQLGDFWAQGSSKLDISFIFFTGASSYGTLNGCHKHFPFDQLQKTTLINTRKYGAQFSSSVSFPNLTYYFSEETGL